MNDRTKLKQTYLEKSYALILLVIFGGIVMHAPLSVGLGVLFPDYELLIKSWKEILMVLALPLAVILVTRRHLWRELLSDWLFHVIVAYGALHIVVSLVLFQGVSATMAGLAIDLRYVLFFGLVYVLIKALPQYRRIALLVGGVGAAIVLGFGVAQLFLPVDILTHIGYSTQTIAPYLTVDQNPDYVRINSTLRGPNPLGNYAIITLAVLAAGAISARRFIATPGRRWLFAAAAIASLVVLWVSYSRSSLIGAVIALVVIVAATVGRHLSRRHWLIALSVVILLVGGLFAARSTSFVANVILHDDPTTGAVTTSNDGHLDSLQEGTERMIRQPLGAGVGSTGSASLQGDAPIIIENQYLFAAHETGWLGLVLFIAVFTMILIRLWQRRSDWLALSILASGLGLAAVGMLLPVWVDDTISIIWWGLAAIALAASRNGGQRG